MRQQRTATHFYYTANMNLAQEAYANNNLVRVYDLLNAFLPSPTTRDLASAREFYWYHLWRSTHQEIQTLRGHEAAVYGVTLSPDGKTLATASWDKTVRLWDMSTRQLVATLRGHDQSVRAVAFSPDGKTLASASKNKTIKLWDVASRRNTVTLKGHEDTVLSVAFSPDGKTLASAGGDNDFKKDYGIRLWFAATDEEVARQRNK